MVSIISAPERDRSTSPSLRQPPAGWRPWRSVPGAPGGDPGDMLSGTDGVHQRNADDHRNRRDDHAVAEGLEPRCDRAFDKPMPATPRMRDENTMGTTVRASSRGKMSTVLEDLRDQGVRPGAAPPRAQLERSLRWPRRRVRGGCEYATAIRSTYRTQRRSLKSY